jgi:hypothetical protein
MRVSGDIFGQHRPFAWQDFSMGSPALSYKMPGKPLPQGTKLPASVATYIKTYDGYYYEDRTRGIVMNMMFVQYTDTITADIANAAEGTFGQWRATGSIVDIQHKALLQISGRQSLVHAGFFQSGGQYNEFNSIVIGDGSKLWQVVVIIRAKDDDLKRTMKTIMDSMKF